MELGLLEQREAEQPPVTLLRQHVDPRVADLSHEPRTRRVVREGVLLGRIDVREPHERSLLLHREERLDVPHGSGREWTTTSVRVGRVSAT